MLLGSYASFHSYIFTFETLLYRHLGLKKYKSRQILITEKEKSLNIFEPHITNIIDWLHIKYLFNNNTLTIILFYMNTYFEL